jgi:hypothetical protein
MSDRCGTSALRTAVARLSAERWAVVDTLLTQPVRHLANLGDRSGEGCSSGSVDGRDPQSSAHIVLKDPTLDIGCTQPARLKQIMSQVPMKTPTALQNLTLSHIRSRSDADTAYCATREMPWGFL